MPRLAAIRLVLAILAGVSAAPHAAAQTTDRPVFATIPRASSVKTAAEAATVLRKLYFISDFHTGGLLGDSLYSRFSRDSRVTAWYAAHLTRALRWARADSLTSRADTLSRDPWVLVGRSFVLSTNSGPAQKQNAQLAIRLASRAFTLAPRDPDIAWRVASAMSSLRGGDTSVIAFVDSVGPRLGNPAELQAARAQSMYYRSFTPKTDTAKMEAAFRAYAAARASDTSNFSAIYGAANAMDGERGHEADAYALAQRAVARSPRSTAARSVYWSALNARTDISRDQRKALVATDRAQWLAQQDSAVWTMWSAASNIQRDTSARAEFVTLRERILAKAPRSPQADAVISASASLIGDSLNRARDTTIAGPKGDSIELRRRYRAAMESYIARPFHANSYDGSNAALRLFLDVREDSTYPTDRLARLVHTMTDGAGPQNFTITHGMAARTLAERKTEFRYAEGLARQGEKFAAEVIADYPEGIFSSVGEKADALDGMKASMRDALAWVFYNEGRHADAEKELNYALDLTKKDATIYYHLGKLRQAQGKADDAEMAFTQGMTVRTRGTNPNRKELETAYRQRHGSMDGWKEYVAALEEKERVTRRARILAKRGTTEASAGNGFTMVNLAGDSVASANLRGRYSVINFWGTWCGPCVAEMPELQQFYDKYKKDSAVVVLTISNDKDLQELKDWMVKRKLTIPTLFDNGFVSAAGINAWPTTWFMDPDGKVQFVAIGNSGALVEEWSWMLDAMKNGKATP